MAPQSPPVLPTSRVIDHFSLVQGGLVYRMQQRVRIAAPASSACWRGAAVAAAIAWLPLFLLCLIADSLSGSKNGIPFLGDFAVNVRLLITLPLLVSAEAFVDHQARAAAKRFLETGLITPEWLPAYERVIRRITRLRDSPLAAALVVAGAFGLSIWLRESPFSAKDLATWEFTGLGSARMLTPAGWWLTLVSHPFYRVLLLRWFWLLFVWAVFLGSVARLPLHCSPAHPDGAAGLAFLGRTQLFFGIFTVACSAAMAGAFANQLTYGGSSMTTLRFNIIGYCILSSAAVAVPLLLLTPKLFQIKDAGLREYGRLAAQYVNRFDQKWVRPGYPAQSLLGTPDIQSLADLSNSFGVVRRMQIVMIDRTTLIGLAVPAVLPMLVLWMTATSADDILKAALRLLI